MSGIISLEKRFICQIIMIRKKILIFLQDGVGGAERMSVLLGKSLFVKQNNVVFCLVNRNCETSIRDFIPENYPIISIPNAGPIKMMWQLVKTIYNERPHVVFSSVMYLNTKILPFRVFFPKKRFVVRCENYLYTFSKTQRFRIGLTYRLADAIIVQTKEMGEELYKQMYIGKGKVFVLQNPVDTELIETMIAQGGSPYLQNGMKHFVASGRFVYQKGFDLLLEAFIKVLDKRKDVDLYILGDIEAEEGKVYNDLLSRAKKAGVDNLLHCVGYKKNPFPYIQCADCFVLSSRWEGLPNVMVESLYLGTPIAAFKCIPVIERIVDDGKNGFLAEKDDVIALSEAMLNTLSLGRVNNTYHSNSINDFVDVICGKSKDTGLQKHI